MIGEISMRREKLWYLKTTANLKISISLMALFVGAVPSLAQQTTNTTSDSYVLSPIIINARRISENLQQVPIAVTVIEADKARNIPVFASNADIARQSPNTSYVDMGGFYTNSMMIRGVGSISPLSADDSSVSMNIDEIPMSAYGLAPSTLDLERVEILRGPQGTLYGRNSQGGAINFISNKLVFDNEYSARAEVGTNGWALGEIIANTQLIDNVLAARLALQYSNRSGDVSNKAIGGEDGQTQVGAARGSLLYQPDLDTTAQLTFDYASNNDKQPTTVLRQAECYPCSGLNPRNDFQRENYGGTFRFEHNFDSFNITTISSIHKLNINTYQDNQDMLIYQAYLGLSPAQTNRRDQNIGGGHQKETSYLQEIRLSSLDEAEIKWTAGVNYYRSEYSDFNDGSKTLNPPAFSGLQSGKLTTNSYAAFGEMTVPIIGNLKGLAGLRVTHEEKNVNYGFIGTGVQGTVDSFDQNSSFKDTFVTGRTGLTYDWNDDFMTFVTIGRGAVAGGYPWHSVNNPFGKQEATFPTSTSWTYETGVKSSLFNGRTILNASLFYNDVSKGHQISYNPALFEYQIIALDYKSYGFELEGRVMVSDAVTLIGGIGYTETKLKNLNENNLLKAKSGNYVPNVPQWTGNIGVEYYTSADHIGINNGDIYALASYQYTDKRPSDVRNSFDLESYGIVNARLGWKNEKLELYAFVNNLLNERYEAFGSYYTATVQVVRPGLGRTIGFGTRVEF